MQSPLLNTLALLLTCSLGAVAGGNDWMSSLDGNLPLSQLSIPGTHNAGARFEPFPGTAKCQTLTISEQLEAGVRFMDIRCRHIDNGFTIHHGPVYQKIDFTDVLNATFAFLATNPDEAVIMSVKQEYTSENNTRSFEATFDSYVARNPKEWRLASDIPTLDEARGKIVLFRRFGASALPKGIAASNWPDNTTFSTKERLRVQDRYVVHDNNDKWNAIQAILNEARHGRPNTLYLNFCSGYKPGSLGIPDITKVSNNINPRLTALLKANPRGRYGIILLDFLDAETASLIFNTNASADRPATGSPAQRQPASSN